MAPHSPSTPAQDPASTPWDTEHDIRLLCCCTSALPSLPPGDHIQPDQPEPVPHAPSQCFCLPCLYFCTNHWQVGPHTALSRPQRCRVSGLPLSLPPPTPISLHGSAVCLLPARSPSLPHHPPPHTLGLTALATARMHGTPTGCLGLRAHSTGRSPALCHPVYLCFSQHVPPLPGPPIH